MQDKTFTKTGCSALNLMQNSEVSEKTKTIVQYGSGLMQLFGINE